MKVTVVRHHEEDAPGLIGEAFEARGAALCVHQYPGDGDLPDVGGSDHVVVLGATWSVNDGGDVGRSVAVEVEWLRAVAARGIGVLGICFGAQLLAVAFGGRVERAPAFEIGWTTVEGVEPDAAVAGREALRVDPAALSPGPWFQSHGDRIVLPPAAVLLARNSLCVQAFTIGRCLGVQFHPELDAVQLARWLDHGVREAIVHAGMEPDDVLAQTIQEEGGARRRAAALVDAYLRSSGA